MNYKNNEVGVFLKLGTWIAVISIILILWIFIAKVDVIAQTSGKIIPEGKIQTIAVLQTSSIEKILVKEGEHVKKGQEVALLDNTSTSASHQQIIDELNIALIRDRGIDSLIHNKEFIKKEDEDQLGFLHVQSEMNAKKTSHKSNLLALDAEALQIRSESMSNQTNLNKLISGKASWEKQAESYKQLQKEGYVSKLMADEKIREANDKVEEISIQRQLVTANDAKFKQSKFKHQLAIDEYRQQLFREKLELSQKIASLKQEEVKAKHNVSLKKLTSPIDGFVKEISIYTPKAVVTEGNVLMTIVPDDNLLKAEVKLKNNDIGYIEVGQKVKLKVETFAFQKYGLIDGVVEKISPDAIEDKDTRQNFYNVIVSFKDNYLEKDGKKYHIKPGMTVNADIVISRRSIFEYLTSPLQKTILESAHER